MHSTNYTNENYEIRIFKYSDRNYRLHACSLVPITFEFHLSKQVKIMTIACVALWFDELNAVKIITCLTMTQKNSSKHIWKPLSKSNILCNGISLNSNKRFFLLLLLLLFSCHCIACHHYIPFLTVKKRNGSVACMNVDRI